MDLRPVQGFLDIGFESIPSRAIGPRVCDDLLEVGSQRKACPVNLGSTATQGGCELRVMIYFPLFLEIYLK